MLDLKCKLDLLRSVDAENKKLNGALRNKEGELSEMRSALQQERDEKMDLLQDRERNARQKDEENKKLQEDNERLRKELSLATEKLKSNQRGAEENLKYRLEQEKDLLLLEQDQDRGAYQRLLKDYHELEQHAEMLEQKLAVHVPGHSRSLSNTSNSSSGQIVSAEMPQDDQNVVSHAIFATARDVLSVTLASLLSVSFYSSPQDFGYGSVRSTASSSTPYSRVETIDWNQQRSDSPPDGQVRSTNNKSPSVIETNDSAAHAPADIGLVLKLQQKLKDVEKEKSRLIRMVEDLERDDCEESSRTQDSFRVMYRADVLHPCRVLTWLTLTTTMCGSLLQLQELEMENAQLKKNLSSLRKTVSLSASPASAQQNLMSNLLLFVLLLRFCIARYPCYAMTRYLARHARHSQTHVGHLFTLYIFIPRVTCLPVVCRV